MAQDETGKPTYRPDIDGLRALAIVMVVGCHVAMPGMGGGFVGVDVFFVISGYLITGLLLGEQEATGRIDIAGFYARRVRRLLPALATVIVATLAAGAVLLLPDQQALLARWARAGLAFAANFFAWSRSADYFAPTSALQPLQHLWTLAVEEQFYLVWPLALAALAWLARAAGLPRGKLIAASLAAIFLGSLALSIFYTPRAPTAAFVLPHTRAWELAAGGLLALAPALPVRIGPWLAWLGLAAIAAATLGFDDNTPFPSFRALLPVAGAAALIAAGPAGPLNRLLATRPAVALGKLSYGWYLWHWPLLAFARNFWGVEHALARDAALALAALLLAATSWRWIEMPVRRQQIAPFATTRATLLSGAAMLAGGLALTFALQVWAGRPVPPGSILDQYLVARRANAREFFCDGRARPSRCAAGDSRASAAVLLWGDSHAAHLMDGLEGAGRAAHVKIVARTKGGCLPGGEPEATLRRDGADFRVDCGRFGDSVLAALPELARQHNIRGILLAGQWDLRRTADGSKVAALVERLHAAGFRVMIARDIPTHPINFATCTIQRGADACALPRAEVEQHTAPVDALLARIAASRPDVRIWSPFDAMCPEGRCVAVADGKLLYRDRAHLTRAGSARLAPSLTPTLAWLAEGPQPPR